MVSDSLVVNEPEGSFNKPVYANAKDSIEIFQKDNIIKIYNSGELTYDKIDLKANFIQMDMNTNIVFAEGVPDDSTGELTGKPVFKEGTESYEMTAMYYNFDSKKAIINGVITEQGGGYLVGERTKKMPDNTFNIKGGKFTTCDNHDHPHFYVKLTKSKTVPNEKTISGPAYLVIEDIPLPVIGVPFGFFPATSKQSSGFLIPSFGDDGTRGFYLQGGGYYWAMSKYADLALTGSYFTKGTWNLNLRSNYKKRYRFSGNINAQFLNAKNDDVALTGNKTFSVKWTHRQDPKAHPTRTFSANVNFTKSGFELANRTTPEQLTNNRKSSSVSYSKQFAGTPFSFSAALNVNSNSADSTLEMSFPQMNLSMRQIYPFKRKKKVGETRWYEKIALSYKTNIKNSIQAKESEFFTAGGTKGKWKSGVSHSIPISTSFNLLNYINVSPSIGYNEYWYFKKTKKYNITDVEDNQDNYALTDTLDGFNRAYDFNSGVSFSTTLYGMYNFKEGLPIKAIRHKIAPSVSINYKPDFANSFWGFYETDPLDPEQSYPVALNSFMGYPRGGESGSIGINLANNIEMKVKSRNDSVSEFEKIKLLDALNFSTSYNMLADSMNLAPVRMTGSTKIKNFLNLSFNATFNPYALNSEGTGYIDQYLINSSKRLADMTNFGLNASFSLNSKMWGDEEDGGGTAGLNKLGQMMDPFYYTDMYVFDYVDFDVPWDFRFKYAYNYKKPYEEKKITQTLTVDGNLNLTDKWKITMRSGYNMTEKALSPTSVSIHRDLHCWEMSFSWVPIGYGNVTTYNFKINVKSSMLKDLKWEKQDRIMNY